MKKKIKIAENHRNLISTFTSLTRKHKSSKLILRTMLNENRKNHGISRVQVLFY